MYDVVNASKTRRLPAQIQDFFYYLTALNFSGSYVRFMSCQKPCYIVFKQYTVKALARVRICASSSEPSL